MVPPHSTMLRRKSYVKQLLKCVNFEFVAHSIAQVVAHEDTAASD